MKKSPNKKHIKYVGFFGFFGFLGFTYFVNQNVSSLFFFSFFAFFSYFFLGQLTTEMPDERYIENANKARLKSAAIPLIALFIIGWTSSFPFATKEFTVIISALGWAITFLTYAILFYYYENH